MGLNTFVCAFVVTYPAIFLRSQPQAVIVTGR
jgi:hypothetical protein